MFPPRLYYCCLSLYFYHIINTTQKLLRIRKIELYATYSQDVDKLFSMP